jgi:hypothetical protein
LVLSRSVEEKELVKIRTSHEAAARELEAQRPVTETRGKEANGRKRKGWKGEIIRVFEEASGDLKGTTDREILAEIKLYRTQRKK